MSVIRTHKRENPFVQLDKHFFNDANLSFKAKGLLGFILQLPDDWKLNMKHLQKVSTDGETSVRSAMKELMKHGYVYRWNERNGNGEISEWCYEVFERPEFNHFIKTEKTASNQPQRDFHDLDLPQRDFHDLDNHVLENHAYTNNDLTNNDLTNNHTYIHGRISEHKKKKGFAPQRTEQNHTKDKLSTINNHTTELKKIESPLIDKDFGKVCQTFEMLIGELNANSQYYIREIYDTHGAEISERAIQSLAAIKPNVKTWKLTAQYKYILSIAESMQEEERNKHINKMPNENRTSYKKANSRKPSIPIVEPISADKEPISPEELAELMALAKKLDGGG